MGTYNLGPCGCCLVYDCECFDTEPTEVKITITGFTGACAVWNGEYFATTPGRTVSESFDDFNILIIQSCEADWWLLAVEITNDFFCFYQYTVLEADEDPRFHCGGGTLEATDITSSDTTTCPDCGPGTITVEFTV